MFHAASVVRFLAAIAVCLPATAAQAAPVLTEKGWDAVAANRKLYIEMPVTGIIGEQVTAESFEITLAAAAANPNIGAVIFTVNSDGGMVMEAERIREVMRKHRGKLVYIAVVEKAISAAIWVVFGCQTIAVCDQATMGGAVVYLSDRTGNVDVDAKLNSIITAGIAGMATYNHHPPDVVAAMMLRPASVYAWNHEGRVMIAGKRPADVREFLLEDGPDSVLTLTGEQAQKINLAKPAGPDAAAFFAAFEKAGWKRANRLGHASIQLGDYQRNVLGAKAFFDQLTHRFKEASATFTQLEELEKSVAAAIEQEPERLVHVVQRNGEGSAEVMIVESVEKFAESASKSRKAWAQNQSRGRLVRAGIVAFIRRIQNKYNYEPSKDDVTAAFHFEEKAKEQMDRLNAIQFSREAAH